MSNWWFFFSYARADLTDAQHGEINYLEQFYLDLEREFRRLKAIPPDEKIGFRDLHTGGIGIGSDWQPEVSRALSESRTLVCLYSPSFFASHNCGKEVQVFLNRRQAAAEQNKISPPPVIIPVMWNEPSAVRSMPESMSHFQHANDLFPRSYNQLGVYSLRQYQNEVDYRKFVNALAKVILERGEKFPLPALSTLPTYDQIPSAFSAADGNGASPVDPRTPAKRPADEVIPVSNEPIPSRIRQIALVSALLFILGNLAIMAGSWQRAITMTYQMAGFNGISAVHTYMSIVVMVILFVAYGAGAHAANQWLAWRRGHRVRWQVAALFTVAAVLFGANVMISQRQTDFYIVLMPWLKQNAYELTERLFQRQLKEGGFPGRGFADAWTTAQCVTAAASAIAGNPNLAQAYAGDVRHAVEYMESALTPDEGWAYTPLKGVAVTEVTSWVTVAYLKTLDPAVRQVIWSDSKQQGEMASRVLRNVKLVLSRQDSSGNWPPALDLPNGARTYSAVMAIWALTLARRCNAVRGQLDPGIDENIQRGIHRLLANYTVFHDFRANPNPDGMPEHHPGLEAMTLYVLSQAEGEIAPFLASDPTYAQAKLAFQNENLQHGRMVSANTRLHDTDSRFEGSDFHSEQSTFLWYPWTLLEDNQLSRDPQLTKSQATKGHDAEEELIFRFGEALDQINHDATYVLDENLFAISELTNSAH